MKEGHGEVPKIRGTKKRRTVYLGREITMRNMIHTYKNK